MNDHRSHTKSPRHLRPSAIALGLVLLAGTAAAENEGGTGSAPPVSDVAIHAPISRLLTDIFARVRGAGSGTGDAQRDAGGGTGQESSHGKGKGAGNGTGRGAGSGTGLD